MEGMFGNLLSGKLFADERFSGMMFLLLARCFHSFFIFKGGNREGKSMTYIFNLGNWRMNHNNIAFIASLFEITMSDNDTRKPV